MFKDLRSAGGTGEILLTHFYVSWKKSVYTDEFVRAVRVQFSTDLGLSVPTKAKESVFFEAAQIVARGSPSSVFGSGAGDLFEKHSAVDRMSNISQVVDLLFNCFDLSAILPIGVSTDHALNRETFRKWYLASPPETKNRCIRNALDSLSVTGSDRFRAMAMIGRYDGLKPINVWTAPNASPTNATTARDERGLVHLEKGAELVEITCESETMSALNKNTWRPSVLDSPGRRWLPFDPIDEGKGLSFTHGATLHLKRFKNRTLGSVDVVGTTEKMIDPIPIVGPNKIPLPGIKIEVLGEVSDAVDEKLGSNADVDFVEFLRNLVKAPSLDVMASELDAL
jgi:hypothetical protein